MNQVRLLAAKVGFKQLRSNGDDEADVRHITVFTREASILTVFTNGSWAFCTEVVGGKAPDTLGKDHGSLAEFLNAQFAPPKPS